MQVATQLEPNFIFHGDTYNVEHNYWTAITSGWHNKPHHTTTNSSPHHPNHPTSPRGQQSSGDCIAKIEDGRFPWMEPKLHVGIGLKLHPNEVEAIASSLEAFSTLSLGLGLSTDRARARNRNARFGKGRWFQIENGSLWDPRKAWTW